jgi:hypothetical protein
MWDNTPACQEPSKLDDQNSVGGTARAVEIALLSHKINRPNKKTLATTLHPPSPGLRPQNPAYAKGLTVLSQNHCPCG